MEWGWLGNFIGGGWNMLQNGPPIMGGLGAGQKAAQQSGEVLEEAIDTAGNYIGRAAIIILGFIFVAAGLMMFRPDVIVEASRDAGKAYKDAKSEQ